jgi:hypothetical protein
MDRTSICRRWCVLYHIFSSVVMYLSTFTTLGEEIRKAYTDVSGAKNTHRTRIYLLEP